MWRSLVAHLAWDEGVAGSNPVIPTITEQTVDTIIGCLFVIFYTEKACCSNAFRTCNAPIGKRLPKTRKVLQSLNFGQENRWLSALKRTPIVRLIPIRVQTKKEEKAPFAY